MGSCVVYLLKSMLFYLSGVLPVCALDTTDPLSENPTLSSMHCPLSNSQSNNVMLRKPLE